MNKQVLRYKEVRDKILSGVDTIADPIRETMSPKGRNVIFQNSNGDYISTNDGVTIAKNIEVSDPVENAVINIIKYSSLRTNTEVGDGTSTSVLLSSILIREGLKLIENGWNQMDVKREFEKVGGEILKALKKKAVPIKTDSDLENIARISANYDDDIAKNVVKVVKTVGEFGMVFLEENNNPETEVEEDIGFQVEQGLFAPELRNNPKGFSASYKNVPVLVTDKRIYYAEEAETILKTVLMNGYKSVVIVARDFIGQSVNTFIANHAKGVCNVLLVKDPNVTEKNNETLEDLATYLGTSIVSEKTGSLVDNLEFSAFTIAERVFADGAKTLIVSGKKQTKELKDRVSAIKKELEKNKNDEALKKRVASLTSGMVTIKVGGATKLDTIERIYRYEDAVSATRAAMKDGYLVGGGIALMNVVSEIGFADGEIAAVFRKFGSGNTRQIAENHGGVHIESLLSQVAKQNEGSKRWVFGLNAVSGEIENLLTAGVIDPYKVTEMAVRNSVAVASQIIGSNFLILNEEIKKEDNG